MVPCDDCGVILEQGVHFLLDAREYDAVGQWTGKSKVVCATCFANNYKDQTEKG